MPYKSVNDLPDAVKKLPQKARDAWMKAFNAAYEQYNDDGKAAAVAWSTVQKMGYVKKGDKWVKAEYVKDLGLKPGTYLHPNIEGEKLTITDKDIKKFVENTTKFIEAGGVIPITVSHPKNEREKIENNEGEVLAVWYDEDENTPYMAFNVSDLVKGWIEEGKLKAVSPGIYHDVITSVGKFPSLIDHIALTNSPFNIKQNGFMPVNAERFTSATLFFENNQYVSKTNSGGIMEELKHLFLEILATLKGETYSREEDKQKQEQRSKKYGIGIKEGGNVTKPGQWKDVSDDDFLDPVNYRYPCPDAEQTRAAVRYWGKPENQEQYTPKERAIINRRLEAKLKQYKIGKYAETESRKEEDDTMDLEAMKQENDELKKKIGDLEAKIADYEKKEKEREEAEKKKAIESFSRKVDKLIEDKKVEPKNKEQLVKNFTILFENKIENADEILLGRFETKETKNELPANAVKIEKEVIDYTTEEGQDKLIKLIDDRAVELWEQSADKDKKSPNAFYEAARAEIIQKYNIDERKLSFSV